MVFWWKQVSLVLVETYHVSKKRDDMVGMVGRFLPAPSLPVLAYLAQSHIPGVENLYWWAFPTMAFIVGLAVSIGFAAVRIQGRLTRVQESLARESPPALEFVFSNEFRACEMKQSRRNEKGEDVPYWVLWRVGIRGTQGKSIQNAEIRLLEFEPQGAGFLPQALHPMEAPLVIAADTPVPSTFAIDPDVVKFVDVVRWFPNRQKDEAFAIAYHLNHLPSPIPEGDYIFRLGASARDVSMIERRFRVFMTDGIGRFEMLMPAFQRGPDSNAPSPSPATAP